MSPVKFLATLTAALVFVSRQEHLALGCKNKQVARSSRVSTVQIVDLTSGELRSVTPGLRLRTGQVVYGRLTVPDTLTSWSVNIIASWTSEESSSPVWLLIRKDALPNTTSWDKTSVTYLARKQTRLGLEDAPPGHYYLAVEAVHNVANLTISIDILPPRQLEELANIEDWSHLNEVEVELQ